MRSQPWVVVLLWAGLAAGTASAGDFDFSPPLVLADVPVIASAVGDVDADGVPDLLMPVESDVPRLALGLGDGTFAEPVPFAGLSPRTVDVVLGDLDGDGDDDVLARRREQPDLVFLRSEGGGRFADPVLVPLAAVPSVAGLIDVDGDGLLDVAAGLAHEGRVDVLLNAGAGVLVPGPSAPAVTTPVRILPADPNGDGLLDLVTVGFQASNQTTDVGCAYGDGAGFGDLVLLTHGSNARDAAVGELTGDGRDDVAVLGAGDVVLMEGVPGGLVPFAQFATPVGQHRRIVATDLDGDGDDDLGIAHGELFKIGVDLQGLSVWKQTAPRRFALDRHYGGTYVLDRVHVEDLDLDGRVDLALQSNQVTLLFGHEAGGFEPSYGFEGLPESHHLADVTGDGTLDLVVGLSSSIEILPGLGGAAFGPPRTIDPGFSLESVQTADWNGDGRLDLFALDRTFDELLVMLARDDGSFAAPVRTDTGGGGSDGAVVGDLDDDGIPDAVVAGAPTNDLGVFLGDHKGRFVFSESLNVEGGIALADTVGIADVDGDSVLDVLTIGSGLDGLLHAFLGAGDGTFGSACLTRLGYPVNDACYADLDGDSRVDAVIERNTPSEIRTYLSASGGCFQLAWTQATPAGSFVTGDFNNDRVLDLAVGTVGASLPNGSTMTGAIDTYPGLGDGTFGPAETTFISNPVPRHLTAGFLSSDATLDLVVGHFSDSYITVLVR